MSYCVLADVQAINSKREYTASSTPTITQVNTLIGMIASKIDAAIIGLSLALPTSNDYLKVMNAFGAAGLAEASLLMNGTAENADTRDWRTKEYDKMMAAFLKEPSIAGFTMTDAGGGSCSNVTEGVSNDEMKITIDGESW